MIRSEIFTAIERERHLQAIKHPGRSIFEVDPLLKLAILTEEVGEVARALIEDDDQLRQELVQVAACAVGWLESME